MKIESARVRRKARPRCPNYNYRSTGPYFVTVRTHESQHAFAHIQDNAIVLTQTGRQIEVAWRALSEAFPRLVVHDFVVMPNHTHALLSLPADGSTSLQMVMRRFKGDATRRARRMGWPPTKPLWQRGYFDRVLREADEDSISRTRAYIRQNPHRWVCRVNNTHREPP